MSTTPELLTPALQQVDTDAITFFTKNGVSNKIAAQDLKKDFGGISYIPSVQEAVGVAAKTASGGPVNLAAGITIEVCFTNGNSAANPTLNYNNTGAKSIMIMKAGNKVAASINPMDAGTILRLRYDGTDWVICGNPVVKTTNDYTSYADGRIVYSSEYTEFRIEESKHVSGRNTPDLNNILETGCFYCLDANNSPYGTYGFLECYVRPDTTDYGYQTWTPYNTNSKYIRIRNAGVWTEWKQVQLV